MIFEPHTPRLRLMMRQKLGRGTLPINMAAPFEANNSIEKKYLFNRKKVFRYAIVIYTLALLSANLIDYNAWQVFYFSYPAGTWLVHVAFCSLIFFTETIGFRRTKQLIWCTTLLNLFFTLTVHYILKLPISEFWVNNDIDNFEAWDQFHVILMLEISYACSSLAMVKVAGWLRIFLGRGWLLLRIFLILLTGFIIDMLALAPVLFFIAPDRYIAFWKMISLVTIKGTLSLIVLPISYFIVLFSKKKKALTSL